MEGYGRDEIYARGKVEYVYGSGVKVRRLRNGFVLLKGILGEIGAVAVWKGGGYVVWVWDGENWFKYVDRRYKEKSVIKYDEVYDKMPSL